jgi:hypothetical protein
MANLNMNQGLEAEFIDDIDDPKSLQVLAGEKIEHPELIKAQSH